MIQFVQVSKAWDATGHQRVTFTVHLVSGSVWSAEWGEESAVQILAADAADKGVCAAVFCLRPPRLACQGEERRLSKNTIP